MVVSAPTFNQAPLICSLQVASAPLCVGSLLGLDTLTPNLIVGDGVKMIGEYEGTVGTYYLFSENDASPNPVHDHTEPPKVNQDKLGSTNKEGPSKEVKHLASVQKILKFRSINEDHQEHRAYQHKDKEFSFDPSNRMYRNTP